MRFSMLVFLMWNLTGCSVKDKVIQDTDIIIKNVEMRLILGNDGKAKSLIHKSTGQECLMQGEKTSVFTITQDRPYDNELQLTYPAKRKTFAANSVSRKGDDLIVGFELTDYEATTELKITDDYIGFTYKKLEYHMAKFGYKRKTLIDEFTLLQLPVKNRTHFGEWLNVVWDDEVAINILATNPFTRIDAVKRNGYKLLYAGGSAEVKIKGVGAALVATEKNKLLDCIDRIERDFGLPLGVESRRSKEYRNSYFEYRGITPENIDDHISFAKMAGFRQMLIYYRSFSTSMGHLQWKPEYPKGMDDLKEITRKIEQAGVIAGLHIHYNKAEKNDAYVTPVPDSRLNLRRVFTLAANLDKNDTIISIEENPAGCTLEDRRRILKVGKELISYKHYTSTYPYQFTGCKRGVLNTNIVKRERGDLLGLLDVDTWPRFVRFNQKTNIQEEVAERLGRIIKEAGFKFIYYDGAEDVPPPYWYNVARAQLAVHSTLEENPIFAEGACKSHFSWHILTRGNAFDFFSPEFIKEATIKHPLAEIEIVTNDFTSINFGWIAYTVPSENTIGIQPDMLEYVTSRAAGYNSVISLVGTLDQLQNHTRTKDNLEVIRRWEEVRATDFLTNEQKEQLKSHYQEHILLINEKGAFELLPYQQIENVANGSKEVRAFIFERNDKTWVVYWHTCGAGNLELPLNADKISLFEKSEKELPVLGNDKNIVIPIGNRPYIQFNLNHEEVVELFSKVSF